MRRFPALVATLVLASASAAGFADDPAPPAAPAAPASDAALSPAMRSALQDFSADDYKTRTAAFTKLELALGAQLRDLVNSNDPEVVSRLAEILQANEGLSRWVSDTLKLPPDQRKAQLAFGLKPEIIPIVALAYSTESQKRADAARALAKVDGPEADALLATLLEDPDRHVYVAAMDTAYDRKPADPVIDALWDRAVDAGLAPYSGSIGNNAPITFRGRTLGGMMSPDMSSLARRRDSALATEVLIHINPPQLVKKIHGFLDGYYKALAGDNPNHLFYNIAGEPYRNVVQLMVASKSKELLPDLYKLAVAPRSQGSEMHMGDERYYWTNRTIPIAAMVTIAGLKPDDYKLRERPHMPGEWTVSDPSDEAAAIKDIYKWYAANVDKDAPAPDPDAVAPAPNNGVGKFGGGQGGGGPGMIIHQAGGNMRPPAPANEPPATQK